MSIIPIVIGFFGTVTESLPQELEDLGGDCPNYSIFEIDQNTAKCSEDLKCLALIETQAENHLLTLMGKTI